jgi:DNA-binding XRE family transcriptional regulator
LRKGIGICRIELAKRANLSKRTVILLETGKTKPKIEILSKIVEALGASEEEKL